MAEKTRGILLLSLVMAALRTAWAVDNTQTTPQAQSSSDGLDHGVDKRATYIVPGDKITADKRAQMAFHGMRGKKDYDSNEDWPTPGQNAIGWEQDEDVVKRGSMGFHGMRGKKWDDYDEAYKRATMGFHGMRGKKDSLDEEKRAMGFHGMRGKKLYENEPYDFAQVLEEDPSLYYNNEEEKRGVSGFQGMRGKKDNEFPDFELDKRGPMGFQGMRGKKSDDDLDMEKRAMGFHGMRGKKLMEFNWKRAMGFLGMRGKKSDDEWQMDKKAQQMGFMGMRGKKDGDDINSLLTYLSDAIPAVERTRRAVLRNSKKAKSAFFGMRGKKSWKYNDSEQIRK